jgi:cytosine/adenosine deaminase-related metal-dependent hydrolase/2-polyprenyl-3-methyl-5-hydroxy-6-metoxy-1,4-benzoquinol methylase
VSPSIESTRVESARRLRNDRAFDELSSSYDTQVNPILLLEQRYLQLMIPNISGHDICDAGCGSGRWLSYLAEKKPRRLTGVDSSSAMIQVSRQKRIPGVQLLQCPIEETTLPRQSFDLILSSFVLSYIDDLERMAAEIDRIARDGCDLFLSDMHPETQYQLGWKRTFTSREGRISFEAVRHSLRGILAVFTSLGWKTCAALEPEFGAPERGVFESAGRLDRFLEADGFPAIYILHLRKAAVPIREAAGREGERECSATLVGGRCSLGPSEAVQASLRIGRTRVTSILSNGFSPCTSATLGLEIDLSGYLVIPGFVNAHDHLEFALFPRMANPPYSNASAWARDIQHTFADVIAKHRSVPRDVRLWWGGIRNLLCGVTTVCHHNAPEPELHRGDFPVRVARDCGWEHSLTFGGDLRAARSATSKARAFIVHACEGIDREAWKELWELDRLNVLDEDAVIVHGLAIDDEGAALLRQRGTSLVLCPSSNQFLFGTVPAMQRFANIDHVALGSDSPLTADGDLLDEIRFAMRCCGISPRRAYRMTTEEPAVILRLRDGEGSIRVDGSADLIAVSDTGCGAAERLQMLSAADVEFVMIGGHVQLASDAILTRLSPAVRQGLEPLWFDGTVRWLRAPIKDLLTRAEEILGVGNVRLGGKPIRLPSFPEVGHAC